MKKAFLYSFFVAALALLSCQKEKLNPLKGVFPQATEATLTTLVSQQTVKTESTREFSFKFSGEGGATLETVLVLARANYALTAGSYVPGTTKGSFIASRTKVNGTAVTDQSGVIVVRNIEGSKDYTFEFALFDQSGKAYRYFWKGEIVYNPDPEPVALSVVLTANSNVASGTNSVTLSLATPGVSYDAATYSYTGNGNYLAVDLYSADGYLHEGVYTASAAGGVINEGEFGIGWDPGDLWGIGMVFENWGTCWWTVDGSATARKITSGTISVQKNGNKWIITWGEEATYPDWAQFEGEIEALTPGDVPNPDYSFIDTPAPGAMDSSWQTHDDVTTHYVTIYDKSNKEVAYLQLVLANETTDLSGEYECKEYAHEDHTCGNGYDAGAYGIGGTRYYKGEELVFVNPGEKVLIVKLADGIYEVSGNGFDYIMGAPGAGGDVEADYTIVDTPAEGAMDSSWQTHTDVTTHYITLFDANEKEVAYFQLVLANGTTDLSGQYACVEYAHEDHTCGNGYDAGAYGIGGTRYYKDEELIFVNPGETVSVTAVSADVYKFSGEGFEFVGKLAAE